MRTGLDIEPLLGLVCSLTGNNIQYGGSCKLKNIYIKLKALNCWNLLILPYKIVTTMSKMVHYVI